jgi:hypothetical protein
MNVLSLYGKKRNKTPTQSALWRSGRGCIAFAAEGALGWRQCKRVLLCVQTLAAFLFALRWFCCLAGFAFCCCWWCFAGASPPSPPRTATHALHPSIQINQTPQGRSKKVLRTLSTRHTMATSPSSGGVFGSEWQLTYDPTRTVYVANIAKDLAEKTLKDFFNFAGSVVKLQITEYAPHPLLLLHCLHPPPHIPYFIAPWKICLATFFLFFFFGTFFSSPVLSLFSLCLSLWPTSSDTM